MWNSMYEVITKLKDKQSVLFRQAIMPAVNYSLSFVIACVAFHLGYFVMGIICAVINIICMIVFLILFCRVFYHAGQADELMIICKAVRKIEEEDNKIVESKEEI